MKSRSREKTGSLTSDPSRMRQTDLPLQGADLQSSLFEHDTAPLVAASSQRWSQLLVLASGRSLGPICSTFFRVWTLHSTSDQIRMYEKTSRVLGVKNWGKDTNYDRSLFTYSFCFNWYSFYTYFCLSLLLNLYLIEFLKFYFDHKIHNRHWSPKVCIALKFKRPWGK
jgi:hypothetical protein